MPKSSPGFNNRSRLNAGNQIEDGIETYEEEVNLLNSFKIMLISVDNYVQTLVQTK